MAALMDCQVESARLNGSIAPSIKEQAEEAAHLPGQFITTANVARWQKIEPELALRDTVHRFAARFYIMEELARGRGLPLDALSPPLWEKLWSEAKKGQVEE